MTVRNSMFRQRSGRARDVLGNCSEHLKNPDGRSERAQAELGSGECTCRPSSSSLPNRARCAMRAPGGKKSVWAGSQARRWIGPHCNGSWACRAAIRGLAHRGARLIDDAHPEHEAVIDTVRGRQCAVLNFPAQNSSFLRGGSYSAVMTRTGGGCIPLSRAQPAPARIARHGF